MGNEIELKLLAGAPEILGAVQADVLAHASRSHSHARTLRSVYYDTADCRLRAADYCLRIRDMGDGFLMTAKGPSGKPRDGVERSEWECRVPGADLDRAALEKVLPADILAALGDTPLEPLFATEVERQEITLVSRSATIEIAVDRGRVVAGGAAESIAELELELKQGDPAALYELALELTRHGALLPCSRSKSDRGYELALGETPGATQAGSLEMRGKDRLEDVVDALFTDALAHLVANLHLVGDEHVPEALHQARVALRRTRTALALVKTIAPSEEMQRLSSEAKWLAGEFGPARDWDVLSLETVPKVARIAPAAGDYDALIAAAAAIRRAENSRARSAACGLRCSRFVLQAGLWMRRQGWRSGASPEAVALLGEHAGTFAADALDRLHRKVTKRGRRFEAMDAPQRHALRIALKKLRYAGDFLLPLTAGRKRTKRYRAVLAGLQDRLGRANDTARTAELLGQLDIETLPAPAVLAIGAVAATQASELRREEKKLVRQWRRFEKLDPPWRDR